MKVMDLLLLLGAAKATKDLANKEDSASLSKRVSDIETTVGVTDEAVFEDVNYGDVIQALVAQVAELESRLDTVELDRTTLTNEMQIAAGDWNINIGGLSDTRKLLSNAPEYVTGIAAVLGATDEQGNLVPIPPSERISTLQFDDVLGRYNMTCWGEKYLHSGDTISNINGPGCDLILDPRWYTDFTLLCLREGVMCFYITSADKKVVIAGRMVSGHDIAVDPVIPAAKISWNSYDVAEWPNEDYSVELEVFGYNNSGQVVAQGLVPEWKIRSSYNVVGIQSPIS